MPKNKKSKQKFRFNWKIAVVAVFGLLVVAGIAAQICFNKYIYEATHEQSTFKMGVLVKAAIDGLDELRTEIGSDGRIAGLRLQLPSPGQGVEGVRYLYHDYHKPEYAQVTSRVLVQAPATRLLTQTKIDELFHILPSVQACSRGFTLQFVQSTDDTSGMKLSGSKQLADSRTLYVYRETACDDDYGMDELESYLLQAESY